MANEIRVRGNFAAGALDAALTNVATSMSSPALADLPAIGATEHAAISLFIADSNGRITSKEIVYVTAHTASATTATILRGQEGTTGVAWAIGDKWEHSATALDFGGAWTAYTPTWTAVTTNPVLGNGTITGAYTQIGKTVHFRMNLTAGSTTTFGTGAWRFGLPVASVVLPSGHALNINGYFEDLGVSPYGVTVARWVSTTTFDVLYHNAALNGQVIEVSNTTPFTWANGDLVRLMGTYEAA